MLNKSLFALAGCTVFIALAGCTPEAREDVGKAGDNLGSATTKSVQGTEQAAAKAGDAVATGTKEAVQTTEKAAADAGQAVATGTKEAVQSTEKAAADAGKAVKDTAAPVALTPKVRNAIIADDKVGTKMLDLNVDTKADAKQVIVMGTASSAAMKAAAIADAKKAVTDSKSDYTVVDQIKVGAPAK